MKLQTSAIDPTENIIIKFAFFFQASLSFQTVGIGIARIKTLWNMLKTAAASKVA